MGAAHFMFKLLTRSWTMCKGRQSLTRSMLWVQMKCIQTSEEMKNIIKLNSYVRLLVLIIFYLHGMKTSDFDNIKEKIICNGDSYKVCNCKKCKCRSVCSNLCNCPRRSKDHLRSFWPNSLFVHDNICDCIYLTFVWQQIIVLYFLFISSILTSIFVQLLVLHVTVIGSVVLYIAIINLNKAQCFHLLN